MLEHHRQGGLGFIGHPTGDHLVQHHTQRVDVTAVIHRIAHTLLGRHVSWRADDGPARGELGRLCHQLGNAKVSEEGVAPLVDQHIAGLDVAVNHILAVGIVQRAAHLGQNPCGLLQVNRPFPGDQVLQGARFDIAHDQVGRAIFLTIVVDRQDMRVLQTGKGSRLLGKAPHKALILGEVTGQDLDGDIAVHGGLVGLEYGSHAAPADLLHDLVGTDPLADVLLHVATSLPQNR